MSIFDDSHDSLFNQQDITERLSYLQSRLSSGDLEQDEALALFSSVHGELSQGRHSPQEYKLYAETMDMFEHSMPHIHAFVTNAWEHREEARASEEESIELEEPVEGEPESTNEKQEAKEESKVESEESAKGGEEEEGAPE